MSGQEKFQVVSAGKTLRARAPEAVLQDAAKTFSLPVSQARRLLIKGWVIKDQLSSKQVLEYRSRLQKIGLRVEVFPAGTFDNRALIAKMQFAQKRRARSQAGSAPASQSSAARSEVAAAPSDQAAEVRNTAVEDATMQPESTRKSAARAQVESLFVHEAPAVGESVAQRVQLLLGALAASLVPVLFVMLLCLCGYTAARALWQIPQALLAGDFGATTAIGSLLSVLLAGFVAALLVFPYFGVRRLAPTGADTIQVETADARGLHLLLEVLAEKTGLPRVQQVSISAGEEVMAEPRLADIHRQQLPLVIGLSAVRALSGNELLALVARVLGTYRGRLGGLTAWLVLDTARRIQQMHWALENERSIAGVNGEVSALNKPWHLALTVCGRAVLPLLDRLDGLHRALTGNIARRLERRGDAWAAQLLGSREFVVFAEQWHRLVHAELVVAEINREAAVAGQRLQNYPTAVQWMLRNLDEETCSNIELAMAQTSDPWDPSQAADNDRIASAEELSLDPLLAREFSVQKLFEHLGELEQAASAAVAATGTRAVDNQRLLCVSKEAEQALQSLGEYFNQLPPHLFLPLEVPASDELCSMDLQETIDWLRGRLVELRELQHRHSNLCERAAAMQLGAALVRQQGDIEPQEFFLTGATPAAADESIRDNRLRREEIGRQVHQIYCMFYVRIQRAMESMGAGERQAAERHLGQLSAYGALAAHLERLDNYAGILGLIIDRLALDNSQRELVQKYFTLAATELEGVFSAVEASAPLRELGLARALEERAERAPMPKLPAKRQELLDALQALELKCKSASAAVAEHYRIQLAQPLEACLKRERELKVKPLRLLAAV